MQAAGNFGVDQLVAFIGGESPGRRATAVRPLDPQHIDNSFSDRMEVTDHHHHSVAAGLGAEDFECRLQRLGIQGREALVEEQ